MAVVVQAANGDAQAAIGGGVGVQAAIADGGGKADDRAGGSRHVVAYQWLGHS